MLKSCVFAIFLIKFSEIFPANRVFPPNAQKWNAWLLNFSEKYAKIMHFCNFLKKNLEDFRRFSQNFPVHSVFPPKPQKLNAEFLKFFEKYDKIRHFSQLS